MQVSLFLFTIYLFCFFPPFRYIDTHCLDTRRRISDGRWQPWEDWVEFKSQLSRWRPTEAVRNFSSVYSGFPSLRLVSNTSLIFNSFATHAVSGMLWSTLRFSVLLVCGCSAFVRELDGRWVRGRNCCSFLVS